MIHQETYEGFIKGPHARHALDINLEGNAILLKGDVTTQKVCNFIDHWLEVLKKNSYEEFSYLSTWKADLPGH